MKSSLVHFGPTQMSPDPRAIQPFAQFDPPGLDPSRSQWINLLPPLEGKSVLKWGTGDFPTIAALHDRGCKKLTCIGPPNAALTSEGVTSVESANHVPLRSEDIAVLDEESFFDADGKGEDIRAKLARISGALKADGLLLIILPEGFAFVALRHRVLKALSREGFKDLQYHLVDSHSEYLHAVVPHSGNPEWAVKYLSSFSFHPPSGALPFLKRAVKTLVYRVTGIYNPRFGLLVLARKVPKEDTIAEASFSERLRKITSKSAEPGSSAVVLWTRPFSGKQQLFNYDTRGFKLLSIGQLSIHSQDPGGLARQSYKNLVLLSSLSEPLAKRRISIPLLLDGNDSGGMTFHVRTAVAGESLDNLIRDCHRRDDRSGLTSLMKASLDLQIVIQEELTKGLGDRAPRVESHYFENYLNLPLHRSGHLVQAGARMVQHGDFAPVNILRDPARDQWGVIDWDWMGASYPPLFDFFTFFTRVHFLERRRKGLTFHEELMESFVDSFFRPTWFSSVVQEQVIRYCDRFQLSYQDTFDHFIQYLLFQCGKYRHVMPGHPEFHSSYEEILRGSIRSKERFVCQ